MAEHASAGGLVRYTGAPVTMAQRVTELLLAWGEGDHAALEQLIADRSSSSNRPTPWLECFVTTS